MKRPRGRPPKKPSVWYHSFRYQAESWRRPRRVVAKVEWHAGELLPRIGFIVTNLHWKSSNVVKFYNGPGTAEQYVKEGKYALNWTRLSCHDFDNNQVRLQLFVLAYNLGNFLRRLALRDSIREWSLTTLKEKLIKIGATVVRHARYFIFQMAEVAVRCSAKSSSESGNSKPFRWHPAEDRLLLQPKLFLRPGHTRTGPGRPYRGPFARIRWPRLPFVAFRDQESWKE